MGKTQKTDKSSSKSKDHYKNKYKKSKIKAKERKDLINHLRKAFKESQKEKAQI